MHVTSKTVSISSEDGDNSMQQMIILSLTKLIGDFEQVLFSIPEDGRILELNLTRATFRAITVRVGFWLWISVCLTLLFSCFPRLMILNSWRMFGSGELIHVGQG